MHMPLEFNHFGWENVARESAWINSRNSRPKKTIFVRGSTQTQIEQWILLTIQSPDRLYLYNSRTWVAFKRFPSAVGEQLGFRSDERGLYGHRLFRVKVVYSLVYPGDSCKVKSAYPVS